MTFSKPKDITYTQMAQWIDSHAYETDVCEETLCQYLYHLVYLNSSKDKLFTCSEQIDDFSIYCVSRILSRIQKDSENTQIKSITNYLKSVLVRWKSDYVREFFSGCPDAELADFHINDFSDYLVDSASEDDFHHYNFSTKELVDVARVHLSKIPRRKNSAEWDNIYISCLLTLEQRIQSALRITSKSCFKYDPQRGDAIVRSLKADPPVLYHLPAHYATYINVLTNEITHAIAAELSHTTASKISVTACIRNLIIAANKLEED